MTSASDSQPSIEEITTTLGLVPLEQEGGLWAQSWRDEHSTGIYFLLQPDDFSAMHRLSYAELWHFYTGDPVELLLLDDAGGVDRPVLGTDLRNGQRPCVAVPANVWMGGRTLGKWSLVGTTVSPPWDASIFELGSRAELMLTYPQASTEIAALTREAG